MTAAQAADRYTADELQQRIDAFVAHQNETGSRMYDRALRLLLDAQEIQQSRVR